METPSFGNGWEGRIVEGRFPLLEWLESSADSESFFTVLQGLQHAVIQLIRTNDAEAELFIAQWNLAKSLSHPHLAKVFAAGRCVIDRDDLVYVVSERTQGTLAKLIQSGALGADHARDLFTPVLDALSYLHENSVVHGFINPSHIQLNGQTPKLAMTDLLIAGSGNRSVLKPDGYSAPELQHGVVSAAADTWSIGMTLWEAMTQTLPTWDASSNNDPEVDESLPSPIREIVQDCLRVDPLPRGTIQSIKERLSEIKCTPLGERATPAEVDNTASPSTPIPTTISEIHVPEAPAVFAAATDTEESSDQVTLASSLAHFEEAHLPRSRVLPYAAIVFAVIALVAVLLARGHRRYIPLADESQGISAIDPHLAEQKSGDAAPPLENRKEPESGLTPAKAEPSSTPPTQAKGLAQLEGQGVSPAVDGPVPQPQSSPDHAEVQPAAKGLVAKQVLPAASPIARREMPRPVEVLIRVSVNRDGTVADAAYVSPGPGNYFARIAQHAALSWEFNPTKRNSGDPEASVWTLRFHFSREKTEATATEDSE